MLGRTVLTKRSSNDQLNLQPLEMSINTLNKGNYIVSVSVEGATYNKMIVVN